MDFRAFVMSLGRGSALALAVDPDSWVTPELRRLRNLEYLGDVWLWAHSDRNSRGPAPMPDPLTEGERRAMVPAEYRFDSVPLDVFDEVLAARQRAAS